MSRSFWEPIEVRRPLLNSVQTLEFLMKLVRTSSRLEPLKEKLWKLPCPQRRYRSKTQFCIIIS